MMPMNSPMLQMVNMLRGGVAPNAIIQRLAMSDPRVAQAQRMISGKTEQELYQMVCNMCREQGMTPDAFARMIGIQIPSER